MADRVKAGADFFSTPLATATFQNSLIELEAAYRAGSLGGSPAESALLRATDLIKVRNDTGANRARGAVVQLGDYLLDDVDFRYPWFAGIAIAAPAWQRHAILTEPIPDDAIGNAQIGGVCLATVTVGDVGHTHARPVAGAYKLTSDMGGPIELVSTPDGTGDKELFVRLAVSIPVLLGKADAAINKGSSGTVSIWTGASGSESDTGINVSNVKNRFSDVASGKWVALTWTGLYGFPYLMAKEC